MPVTLGRNLTGVPDWACAGIDHGIRIVGLPAVDASLPEEAGAGRHGKIRGCPMPPCLRPTGQLCTPMGIELFALLTPRCVGSCRSRPSGRDVWVIPSSPPHKKVLRECCGDLKTSEKVQQRSRTATNRHAQVLRIGWRPFEASQPAALFDGTRPSNCCRATRLECSTTGVKKDLLSSARSVPAGCESFDYELLLLAGSAGGSLRPG